jgi:RNA polymerase sigma-70 factor (ECF subfamily)
MQSHSDEDLITELGRGQTTALDELYARYAGQLYAYCRHATHNPPDQEVEDLVQDIFLRLIKAAHTFDPTKASFKTWFYAIARNRCIDFQRRDSKFPLLSLDRDQDNKGEEAYLGWGETLPDTEENTESRVIENALHQAISDCIAELHDLEERQAILLYYLAGKVYREIAEILGKSLSTAKNRVHSAQRKVKACLESKGIHSG